MTKPAPPGRTLSPAMRFLWIVAGVLIAFILLAIGYRLFEPQILRLAMVPGHDFSEEAPPPPPDYRKAAAWAARPDVPNPSMEAPTGFRAAPHPEAAVFFVHPTTYLERGHWNAPDDHAEARRRIDQSLRHQASPFNGIAAVWAPRYRQATFGAFLDAGSPSSRQALALAYGDVAGAWDAFLAAVPPDAPLILAGHSQGSLHLLRLLKEQVAGKPVARRLVAAYVIGWPVSRAVDLPALDGLPPCDSPRQTGCLVSWQSLGDSEGARALQASFAPALGLTGAPLGTTALLCVNPITFWADRRPVPADANLGSLPFYKTGTPVGDLLPGVTGAACTADGFVMLDPPPGDPFAELKMPGENYHTYDINLFWSNLRANVEARVSAFVQPQ